MTRLRWFSALAAVFPLLLLASPSALADDEAEGEICTGLAIVSWDVDFGGLMVRGAELSVPGCDDGEPVGLRLLTTDGELPAAEQLWAEVEDEFATFDLTDLEVEIEPLIGVRVYLVIDGVPTPLATIRVEQRFFNVPGSEQNGLRVTTELSVALGSAYSVPAANDGWEHVDCDDVNLQVDEDPIATGIGQFEAETSGLHIACYQQVPGDGGPPGADEPEVLGVVLERDEDAVSAGEQPPTAVLGEILARTGVSTIHLVVFGGLALLLGIELVRRRRSGNPSVG